MRSISVSRVLCYLGCSLQYRFRYVDLIPAPWRPAALAFGSSVHAAVEWFHRERIEGRTAASDDVVRIFEADWFAQNLEPIVFPDAESQAELLTKGRALIALYVETVSDHVPATVEEPFELDLKDPESGELFGIRLRGIIDLVELDGTVVDLKTAARTLDSGSLSRHLQLSVYALARLLVTGSVPALRLDSLLKTKTPRLEQQPTTRSLEDLSWTVRLIVGVARAIDQGMFFPNPSWRCTECEYFAHCQAWRGEESQLSAPPSLPPAALAFAV